MDSQLKISHLLSVFSKKHRSELESELGMPLENFLYGNNDLTDELEQGEQASGGGYGDVYLYQAKDKENSSKLSSCASDMFAVKKLRYWEANEKTGKNFLREIRAWSKLNHRNVYKFWGFVHRKDAKFPCLVSEFYPNGNSIEYLKNTNRKVDIISLFEGIAMGLEHLHDKDVIHNDIKGNNILIANDGRALIADFGISRIGKPGAELTVSTTDKARSTRWRAFELMEAEVADEDFRYAPTKEADVWSFGCTLLELISGDVPYSGILAPRVTVLQSNGTLPPFPRNFKRKDFEKYRGHIEIICLFHCWVKKPKDRSNMRKLRWMFSSLKTYFASQEKEYRRQEDPTIDALKGANRNREEKIEGLGYRMERFNLDEKHIKYEESEGYKPTDNIKALGSLVEHSGSKLYRPIGLEPTYSSKSRADSFEPENRTITPTISKLEATRRPWEKIPPPPYPSLVIETGTNLLLLVQRSPVAFVEGKTNTYRDERSEDIHTVSFYYKGKIYAEGRADRKKQARENAALETLKKFYEDYPGDFRTHFSKLSYYNKFCLFLEKRELNSEMEINIQESRDGVYYGTANFRNVTIAQYECKGGKGEAMEMLARKAAMVWIKDYSRAKDRETVKGDQY